MADLIDQVKRHIENIGWPYQADGERQVLLLTFGAPGGAMQVAIWTLGNHAVLIAASEVNSVEEGDAGALATFAWHLPAVSISRDPADGEVQVRAWLPVAEGQVPAELLVAAVGAVVTNASLVRAALELVRSGIDPKKALAQAAAEVDGGAEPSESSETPEELNAVQRQVQSLLQGLGAASDQGRFVLEHLDEFDDEVLAELERLRERAQVGGDTDFAASVARLLESVHEWRVQLSAPSPESEARVPPEVRLLLAELAQLQDSDELGDLRRQQALCDAILQQVNRTTHAELWAAVQGTLGNACQTMFEVTGEERQVQAAVAAYEAALTVLTKQASPTNWAMTQINLGILYARLYAVTGEERKAQAAAAAYEAALTVLTKQASPTNWAITQNNQGNLYARLYDVTGEERQAQAAVAAFEAALTVFTKQANPTQWANIQNNLGLLYVSLYATRGEERQVQAAVAAYEAALTVRTKEASPTDWAMTQKNLGDLYRRLYDVTGEEGQAQAAAAAYEAALTIYTKQASPSDWATTQNNLGILYLRLYEATGDARQAQAALAAFEGALTVLTKQVSPSDWATTQNNLGILYQRMYEATGEEGQAQAALAAFEAALTVRTKRANPTSWAGTQNNLGILYQRLYAATGEEEQAQAAVAAYEATLTVFTKQASPTNWASTQNNLGLLYLSLYKVMGEERQAQAALAAFEAALTVHTKQASPTNWAGTQINLGNVYLRLYDVTTEERQAQAAVAAYEAALTVYTRQASPTNWATTQNNLGNLYLRLYDVTTEEGLAQAALAAFEAALTVRTKHASPTNWAMTQNNLGNLYARLYEATGEEGQAQAALAAFEAALTVYTKQASPVDAEQTATNLAQLRQRRQDWSAAHSAYALALEAANLRYLAAPGDNERRRLMADHVRLYRSDARVLLAMQRPAAAMLRLLEGRARALSEAVGLEAQARLRHGEGAVDELRAARRAVQAADHAVQLADRQHELSPSPATRQAATDARRELSAAYQTLQEIVVRLDLEPPVFTEADLHALAMPSDMAAVTVLLDAEQSHALVLHGGEVAAVPIALPAAMVDQLLRVLLDGMQSWIDAYNNRNRARFALHQGQNQAGAEKAVLEAAAASAEAQWRQALDEIAAMPPETDVGWYHAYQVAFEATPGESHRAAERRAQAVWQHTVARVLAALKAELWGPLAAALPKTVSQVLFIPSGGLALLPVHAAAPDTLVVAYAPTLSVWQQCQERITTSGAAANKRLFLATPAEDLFFTQAEAAWLQHRSAAVTWLDGQQATVAAVSSGAAGHGVVHFSGHGSYSWNDPLQSALHCSDGPLMLTDIRQHMDLRLARLITLSACSTGMSDVFASGEEFVGLPAILLEVGAPAVLASLWPVHDVSTAFLMDRFYELWLGAGLNDERPSIAQALHDAARWLRTATKPDLLRRIGESTLSPQVKTTTQQLLDKFLDVEAVRMLAGAEYQVIDYLHSRPDEHPFAHPHYWAAFAPFGAVGK